MNHSSFLTRSLGLLAVLLLIVIAVLWHALALNKLPYTIGAPVVPSSMLPAGMTLKTYDVPAGSPAPTVAFTIEQDSMGGWDVHVSSTNFTLSPEHLNGAAVAGEGHYHLYIDDNLIIMLGDWYHIDSLTPGDHVIRVGLFNNDHSAYSVDGKQVEAEQTLKVSAAQPSDMGAMEMPADATTSAATSSMPAMDMQGM